MIIHNEAWMIRILGIGLAILINNIDDDLPLGVDLFQVVEDFRGMMLRVGLTNHGHELSRFV